MYLFLLFCSVFCPELCFAHIFCHHTATLKLKLPFKNPVSVNTYITKNQCCIFCFFFHLINVSCQCCDWSFWLSGHIVQPSWLSELFCQCRCTRKETCCRHIHHWRSSELLAVHYSCCPEQGPRKRKGWLQQKQLGSVKRCISLTIQWVWRLLKW